MRIRGKRSLHDPLIFLLCASFSVAFFVVTGQYIVSSFTWYLAAILSFFVALFISSGFGMLFEERSRLGGILLLTVFLPYAYFFGLQNNVLRFDGMIPGLLLGVGFILHAFINNRFDIVAAKTKSFFKIFFVGMLLYLFYVFLRLIDTEVSRSRAQYTQTGSNELFLFILSFFILLILFVIVMRYLQGIKASDVFVYGPSKSGKTLLLLALYNQFVHCYDGQRNETIISSSGDEDYYRIENMLAELKTGRQPKSNQKTDLALYVLKGKKFVKPIEFCFVDYGGEFTENLNPEEYAKAIVEISNQIPGTDRAILHEKIGNHDYIKQLKDTHPDELVYVLDQLVLAHVYKKLQNAGKVIFLVDGEHIISYHEDGEGHLTRLFGQYSRIMELFGEGKSYAIVVTKADKIKNIADVVDNSKGAKQIENEIYKMLEEIDTFKEIRNRASKEPIHFYVVSANSLRSIHNKEETMKNINPWRVEQIAKFGF